MKKKTSKRTKVALGITLPIIAIVIALVAVYFAMQVPLEYDESAVQKVETRMVKTEWNGYTALVKTNVDGSYSDEAIKILNLTDLHLCEKADKNELTLDAIIKSVVTEKPDLVTLTGDTITSVFNATRAKQFGELMDDLGIYWAPVLGNHEGDGICSVPRSSYPAVWKNSEYCLMGDDAPEISGNANYVVVLLGADFKPTQSLIFIDSHDEISDADAEEKGVEKETYDYIKADQIAWYSATVADINAKAGGIVKSTMFIHIPLCEYQIAYDELSVGGEIAYNIPNANGTEMLFGAKNEGICCSKFNSGMFAAILAGGSTSLVVCGHDHINNFAVIYKGITLAYGQPGGYGTYTMESKGLGENINGYSIITVENGTATIASYKY